MAAVFSALVNSDRFVCIGPAETRYRKIVRNKEIQKKKNVTVSITNDPRYENFLKSVYTPNFLTVYTIFVVEL